MRLKLAAAFVQEAFVDPLKPVFKFGAVASAFALLLAVFVIFRETIAKIIVGTICLSIVVGSLYYLKIHVSQSWESAKERVE